MSEVVAAKVTVEIEFKDGTKATGQAYPRYDGPDIGEDFKWLSVPWYLAAFDAAVSGKPAPILKLVE